MAATLKARSGSSLKADLEFWNEDRSALIDTTGKTLTFQLRGAEPPHRIILSTQEYVGDTPPAGAAIIRVEPGHWQIFLGASITRSLPPSAVFELELVANDNPDDIEFLGSGVIMTEPEIVIR